MARSGCARGVASLRAGRGLARQRMAMPGAVWWLCAVGQARRWSRGAVQRPRFSCTMRDGRTRGAFRFPWHG